MICDNCLDDRSTINYRGYELCRDCRGDDVIDKIDRRIDRNEALGHTGSDMCGCEMCAAREETA